MQLSTRQLRIARRELKMPEAHRFHYLKKWRDAGFDVAEWLEEIVSPLRLPVLRRRGPIQPDSVFLENTTILVKSFLRPTCLWRLYLSIRKYYPRIKISIVDDSTEEVKDYDVFHNLSRDPLVTLDFLPFDSGIGMGRNRALKNATTEYVILCDDDFVFTADTHIEKLLRPVASDTVDVMGGCVQMNGTAANWTALIDTNHKPPVVTAFVSKQSYDVHGTEVFSAELIMNFFACRADFLEENKWDEQHKIAFEHLDFFLTLRVNKACIGWTKDVVMGHGQYQVGDYSGYRNRRDDGRQIMNKKWGGLPVTFKHQDVTDRTYESTDDAISKLKDRPNIVVMGTGRCGSSVLVQVLSRMGWHTGRVHPEYWEHQGILDMTKDHVISSEAATSLIKELPEPWIVKQPRFAAQWRYWKPAIPEDTLMVLLERSTEQVVDSMFAAGWSGGLSKDAVTRDMESRAVQCRENFDDWTGPKFCVQFEQLRSAISVFDTSRGFGHGDG
jgi:hypothetical protein